MPQILFSTRKRGSVSPSFAADLKEFVRLQSEFYSFLQAGFECSTHRLKDGRRLDLVAATCHERFAMEDYRRLLAFGIRTVWEGLRWHLFQRSRGNYDFSSILSLLDAAQELGMEQIIDLLHFGWPDYLDILSPDFVGSFGDFAFEFARLLRVRGLKTPYIAPVNEVSFVSWAGGDTGYLNPFQQQRGAELKRQLVRAALNARETFLGELPLSRLVWPEPVIHIAGDAQKPGDKEEAEKYRLAMYEVWDMLSGRLHPELGGMPHVVDMIGVNFYDPE